MVWTLIGHGLEHMLQDLPSGAAVSFFNELGDGELGSPVDAHEETELALRRLHLSDVEVKEPDGVTLELLALRLVPLDIRQARDPVPLQAPVQRRSCKMRDRRL